jgi:hypothetical protein
MPSYRAAITGVFLLSDVPIQPGELYEDHEKAAGLLVVGRDGHGSRSSHHRKPGDGRPGRT